MKIVTVVGARPQFIKAAVVLHELRKKHTEILVHTGQHFDYSMSERFFKELDIPQPDYSLGVSGGTHAQMTGKMMIHIEEVLRREKPDWLLVYGDMNSTLAAALAGAKLYIPVCHAEAGARTHSRTNPEEINRICTDHIASLLFACTKSSMDEMKKEGLAGRGYLTGDLMYDAFIKYSGKARLSDLKLTVLGHTLSVKIPQKYYYLTCHREENTIRDENLTEILKAMECMDAPTVYPIHSRNKEKYGFANLILTEPAGYLESICLLKHAEKVVTDSGGLQRGAFFAGKKCVTVLDFAAWPETMTDGRNVLSRPQADEIVKKLKEPQWVDASYQPFGDGNAAKRIVKLLEENRAIF